MQRISRQVADRHSSGRKLFSDERWYTGDGWRCAVDGNVEFGQSVLSDDRWTIGISADAER